MYIRSLEIENIRTFERAKLKLGVPPSAAGDRPAAMQNVNLLLGDNGSGKTTVLRAAALAVLGPVLAEGSGFVPFSLVRRSDRRNADMVPRARVAAQLELHDQDGRIGTESSELSLQRTRGWLDRFAERRPIPPWAELLWEENSPGFFIVGYGSSRRVDPNASFSEELRSRSRALRYTRIAGLFEEAVTLAPLSSWLPRLARDYPERQREAVSLLNRMLDGRAKLLAEPAENDEYVFRVDGATLPFQALSDGLRAYLGWVADLLYHLSFGRHDGKKLVDRRGVVLVDEVDLHLHPEWQQRVIPVLSSALPNLQFLLTSHSPLVVGTLRNANIFVLEKDPENGVSLVRCHTEEVYGLSADQILTSGSFGLSSSRDPRFTRKLQAQAKTARAGDPEAAIQMMRLMTLGGAAEEGELPAPESKTGTGAKDR